MAEIARALLGESPIGIVGALLQWLTLAILIPLVMLTKSLTPLGTIGLALAGVATLVGGLAFSFRGKSLGPIVAISGVLGVAIIVLFAALLYPLRWLTRDGPGMDSPYR